MMQEIRSLALLLMLASFGASSDELVRLSPTAAPEKFFVGIAHRVPFEDLSVEAKLGTTEVRKDFGYATFTAGTQLMLTVTVKDYGGEKFADYVAGVLLGEGAVLGAKEDSMPSQAYLNVQALTARAFALQRAGVTRSTASIPRKKADGSTEMILVQLVRDPQGLQEWPHVIDSTQFQMFVEPHILTATVYPWGAAKGSVIEKRDEFRYAALTTAANIGGGASVYWGTQKVDTQYFDATGYSAAVDVDYKGFTRSSEETIRNASAGDFENQNHLPYLRMAPSPDGAKQGIGHGRGMSQEGAKKMAAAVKG